MNGIAVLALAACIAPGSGLGAQTPMQARADSQAAASRASAGRWWVDFVFPTIATRQAVCRTGWSADRVHERAYGSYGWAIIARPSEPTDWNTPFLQVVIRFELPRKAPLTLARLDSALTAKRPTVEELWGEPPSVRRQITPVRAWARVDSGRVLVRVEGEAAARAFLRARNDSVTLAWCDGSVTAPYVGGPVTLR